MATTTGPVNGAKPNQSFLTGAVYNATAPVVPDTSQCALQCDVNGHLLVTATFSGTISGNAAAGPTGAPVPASADFIGFNVGGNLVGVSAVNPLPITGTISASNPSVAATGGAPPASATYAGGNKSGVFTGFLIDASGYLQVSAAALPLPAGAATAANQVPPGTAGTPNAAVQSVQGVAGGTAVPISGTVTVTPSGTQVVTGNKTNNNAAPDATNIGALAAVANGASPTWTEGDQVLQSVALNGHMRVGTKTHNSTAPVANSNVGSLGAIANAAAPTFTEGDQVLQSTDLAGNTRVVIGAGTAIIGVVTGNLTNNNAAPTTTNVGVLPAIANAADPSWTEGDQVLASVTLGGKLRVTNEPNNQGGLLIKSASGLTNTAVAIKASAGQIYGWFLDNTENTLTTFFQIYNIASGSVTVGTSTPVMSFAVPGGGSANIMNTMGISFATAISIAATTGYSNGTAPANAVTFNIFYF